MLRYARVLLRAAWCQGAEARDERGEPVEPWDVLAVSWSLTGAIKAVAHDAGELERDALTALELTLEVPVRELPAWNDAAGRLQWDVVAACERAIELVPLLVTRHLAEGVR